MNHFASHKGELYAEGVPLADIASRYGTPAYVYSKKALSEHFLAYEQALSGHSHLVCYAVKANSNLAVLKLLADLGAGFDIVSAGELKRVLTVGGSADKTVFSGVGKRADEIEYALKAGIHCFNVESKGELEQIQRIARNLNTTAAISLRINPDVDALTHPYISTGLKENKFGIDIDTAFTVYQQAAALPNVKIIGIDCHIGSQLTEIEPFLDALDRALALVGKLTEIGINVEHLDLGGGLGVRYRDETPPPIKDYIAAVLEKLQERNLTLIVEPGRSITANAGILLTRVEYIKNNGDKNFVVVDAAMNDMIRPTLYDAWLNIEPVHSEANQLEEVCDIVGPVCETGDFLGKDRRLAVKQGDLLCVHSAGAYGFTMSSNYNTRPRAAEIMVDETTIHLVRERETIDSLMRGEHTLPETP
ncbi:MAG: diaminopimelate decarboxylase [Gammaproteobacteria bacterium]|nr:MAG: diaminopimelate decarboxylase [Gammaproteobacteria bacterium]RLA54098.1 MAG: diaminopimelate decarboxylase [Gammaproteobacteria bacterium]